MKVVIVEDEFAASEHLKGLLMSLQPDMEILEEIDSVAAAIDYFTQARQVDLIFMDIHLADGLSFEIFEAITIDIPIVFVTAFDQYAIKAFQVHSVDYLLKPVIKEDLARALDKFDRMATKEPANNDLAQILKQLAQPNTFYKSTFLVQKRDELLPIFVDDIAYIYVDTGINKLVTRSGETYVVNTKMETLEQQLHPDAFYRVNRQFIVHKQAVVHLKQYFNGKLLLKVSPETDQRIVISKAKARDVKQWLDR